MTSLSAKQGQGTVTAFKAENPPIPNSLEDSKPPKSNADLTIQTLNMYIHIYIYMPYITPISPLYNSAYSLYNPQKPSLQQRSKP